MALQRRKPLERRTPLRGAERLDAEAKASHRKTPERGAGPKRKTPLKSSGAISPATPQQRAAVRDRACIVCAAQPCDPMHLIDRSMAPAAGDDVLAVVPACRTCHRAYDDGDLDLLPHLEVAGAWRDQIAWAVQAVGLMSALKRITKCRDWRSDSEQMIGFQQRKADRFKTALEGVAFREQCADGEAEDMRQIARAALGWNVLEHDTGAAA